MVSYFMYENKKGPKRKLVLPRLQKGQEKEEVDISLLTYFRNP